MRCSQCSSVIPKRSNICPVCGTRHDLSLNEDAKPVSDSSSVLKGSGTKNFFNEPSPPADLRFHSKKKLLQAQEQGSADSHALKGNFFQPKKLTAPEGGMAAPSENSSPFKKPALTPAKGFMPPDNPSMEKHDSATAIKPAPKPSPAYIPAKPDSSNAASKAKHTSNASPKKWWILGCAAAIVAVMLLLLIPGGNSSGNAYQTAIKTRLDSEKVNGTDIALSYQYSNAMLDAIDYKIVSTDKSSGSARVTFTYVDAMLLADGYTGSIHDQVSFYQHCIDTIKAHQAPTISKTITVYFEKDTNAGGELAVVDSPELADVLTGGVASWYQNMIGG